MNANFMFACVLCVYILRMGASLIASCGPKLVPVKDLGTLSLIRALEFPVFTHTYRCMCIKNAHTQIVCFSCTDVLYNRQGRTKRFGVPAVMIIIPVVVATTILYYHVFTTVVACFTSILAVSLRTF